MVQITVLGAGVVGLSTAVAIQRLIPSASVTVFAEKFSLETTSAGAAGIVAINNPENFGVTPETLCRWVEAGFQHYHSLAYSTEANEAGVRVVSGYFLHNTPTKRLTPDIFYHSRPCTEKELQLLPVKYKHGRFVTTCLVECRLYLPYMMRVFKENGGRVRQGTVKTVEEFVGQCDVLVNCSALSSRYLFGDNQMVPIRGQTMRVAAPWVKHFYFDIETDTTYVFPGTDYVVIGGTKQKGDEFLGNREEDKQGILKRCIQLLPTLKNAKVLAEWTGLRPHRNPLRLEKEDLKFPQGKLTVVHNYGHGASGVSMSWGTALDAAKLVQQALHSQGLTSRL